MTGPVIGFAGLTHLGLVSAVGAASKGFRVVGYDPDAERVAAIRAGRLPVIEPGLDELARAHAGRLSFIDRAAELATCDLVYLSTDVPTDDAGRSDLNSIGFMVNAVLATLSPKALLVVLCQVPPGYTRRIALAPDRLYYQVETLVFGRAVERAIEPERFIVGCADPAKPLPPAFGAYLGAYGCPILPMRYESAELCKIAINCCLVASVTVANTLAELSEGIGADWGEIAPALRLDRRIGQFSYLAPGLGIAGGNLERDLATVLRLSEETGSEASTIGAFLRSSRHCRDWALRLLHREVLAAAPEATLAVLGLAYKENTHSTKNSPSLALIENLGPWRLKLYDPVVPASIVSHPNAFGAASAFEAVKGADALLVMTPWPEFRDLKPDELAKAMRGKIVIDPYRVFHPSAMEAAGLVHFTLGRSPDRSSSAP
jgi:UDPglucose 6-dehydrogenase